MFTIIRFAYTKHFNRFAIALVIMIATGHESDMVSHLTSIVFISLFSSCTEYGLGNSKISIAIRFFHGGLIEIERIQAF